MPRSYVRSGEPESFETYVLSVTSWGRVYGRLREPNLTPPRKPRQLYKNKVTAVT